MELALQAPDQVLEETQLESAEVARLGMPERGLVSVESEQAQEEPEDLLEVSVKAREVTLPVLVEAVVLQIQQLDWLSLGQASGLVEMALFLEALEMEQEGIHSPLVEAVPPPAARLLLSVVLDLEQEAVDLLEEQERVQVEPQTALEAQED